MYKIKHTENGITKKYIAAKYILPIEYQQVKYIESSGTQYIDTGVVPNGYTRTQIKFRTGSGANVTFGYGIRDTSDDLMMYESINYRFFSYQTSWYCDIGYGNGDGDNHRITSAVGTASVNTIYELEYGNRYLKDLSNNSYIIQGTPLNVSGFVYPSNYTLKIFKYNSNLPSGISNRVYYCKIYNNSTLVRDFVPCYRKSDGEIGLYDLVNDVFYTNAGTGTFAKGNNIVKFKKYKIGDEQYVG